MAEGTCSTCGASFTGRADKRFCSDDCRARAHAISPTLCAVTPCGRPSRNAAAALCGTHYFRSRRGGSFDRRHEPTGRSAHAAGYWLVYLPGHPLAHADGWAYEHRVVLYEAIGSGEHSCQWCGKPVTWDLTYPQSLDALVADHLDGDVAANRPDNLVPACGPCNWGRRAA